MQAIHVDRESAVFWTKARRFAPRPPNHAPAYRENASNVASASFFGCRLFGGLFKTLAVLCTLQRWPRVFGPHLFHPCQAERTVGDRELGRHRESAMLEVVEEQFSPGLGAVAHAVVGGRRAPSCTPVCTHDDR
jgi:hypothetical protein